MIIDAHTHVGIWGTKTGKLAFEGSLKLLLKEMKANHVDRALVIANYEKTNFNLSMVDELKLTREAKNLINIGSLDVLHYTEKDLDLLDELLNKKLIGGIKLHLGYQNFYPYEKICHPIYKLCLKHDAPVIFHTGDTLAIPGEPAAKVKYSHPLHVDEVATEFPSLKIIIAHMGNPWLVDCAEVLYKNDNVYADISGLVVEDADLNSAYGTLMKNRIQELYVYSSPRKLLYGTDWPLASMKTYVNFTKSLGIAKRDLDYVFYKNAVELFKL